MKKITIDIPATHDLSYPIFIGSDLISNFETWLPKKLDYDHIVLITDNTVKKFYGNHFLQLKNKKFFLLSFPAGEQSKNQKTKQILEEKMLSLRCNRNTLCIALGGGVVGDMAGFVSATYMRGIPYIQIPTTLLAMVDSSIGGKTGIDTPYGKNLIGAFWQPSTVIADTTFLKTLPKKQMICGLIEAIKMFLTNDVASLRYVEKNLDVILLNHPSSGAQRRMRGDSTKILENIIYRAVKIKSDIVQQDEKEKSGPRMICNFGHTIGHALEKITDYKILHGFAVAYGILVEAKIAQLLGLLSIDNYFKIESLLSRLGFSGQYLKKFNIHDVISATKLDKKARSGHVYYVLLKTLGEVYKRDDRYAHAVSDKIVRQGFLEI